MIYKNKFIIILMIENIEFLVINRVGLYIMGMGFGWLFVISIKWEVLKRIFFSSNLVVIYVSLSWVLSMGEKVGFEV